MEPMQYTASLVTRRLIDGSPAMSARPDAPVLPERTSRHRSIAQVLRAVGRPRRRRRLAIRHRPVRGHATPVSG
jgi:hypothetical protein